MKKLVLSLVFISTGIVSGVSQNKNTQDVTTEKVTRIKDSDGEKTIVKKTEEVREQAIEFKNADTNELNKVQAVTPIKVTKNVEVTVDGVKRYIDVDRSGKYESLGKIYYITLDKVGYTVRNEKGKVIASLRENENGNYVHADKSKVSSVWFDDAGNIVVETYEFKDDTFTKYFYKKIQ